MSLFKSTVSEAASAAIAAGQTLAIDPVLGGDDVLAASRALSAIANPAGMMRPFLPHQAAAYLYAHDAIERWGAVLIGDDMGLGKTQVFLALLNDAVRTSGGYGIIVAPNVTLGGYIMDLQAAFPALRFHQLFGRTADFTNLPPADIYFVSEDTQSMRAWLAHKGVDKHGKTAWYANSFVTGAAMLVRDELHRDKGNGGKAKAGSRADLMMRIGKALRSQGTPIVGATGTILTNRPVEAYIPLQILGGDALVKAVTPGAKGKYDFLRRYTNPSHNGFGWNYNGVNMAEMVNLNEMLRRTVYVRREKRDIPTPLPHGGWLVKPIALNGVLRRYNDLATDFLRTVYATKGKLAAERAARAEQITRMNALREEIGYAKAKAAAEYIMELVEEGRSVVAFYEHTKVFDALAREFIIRQVPVSIINGSITDNPRTGNMARSEQVADFQSGRTKVMLAQTRAAGIGVTLTAAADAVFVQLPWSAGDLKQAADRILRTDAISQARALAGEAVTWHVLNGAQADGRPTFDGALWDVLEMKAQVVDAVNSGKAITMPDGSVQELALEAWFAAQ